MSDNENQLFEVKTEFTMYVVAADREQAEKIAQENAQEEFRNIGGGHGCNFDAYPAGRCVDADWEKMDPYGENEGKTCGQWADQAKPTLAQERVGDQIDRMKAEGRIPFE